MNIIKRSVIGKIADKSDPILIEGNIIQPGYIFFSEKTPEDIFIAYLGKKEDVRKRLIDSQKTKSVGKTFTIPPEKDFYLIEKTIPLKLLSSQKNSATFIILDKSHWNFSLEYLVYKIHQESTTILWTIEALNSYKEAKYIQMNKSTYINPI